MIDFPVSGPTPQPITISHAFGEITWLISQSDRHYDLRVADLVWFAMPAVEHRQFHFFRDGQKPAGVALWANVSESVERKIVQELDQPRGRMSATEWVSGDRLWLIDLITPFATPENRHREIMFGDLIAGRFKGRSFKMIRIDPSSAKKDVITVADDAGDSLVDAIRQRAAGGEQA